MCFISTLFKRKTDRISYKKLVKLAQEKGKTEYLYEFIGNCIDYFLQDAFKEEKAKEQYGNEIKIMIPKLNRELGVDLDITKYDEIIYGVLNEYFLEREKKIKWWMM